MSDKKVAALAQAFVALKLLHDNALTPAAKRVAGRAAGNCLWALEIDQHSGIAAIAPEGPSIDHDATRQLPSRRKSQ
ncbi:MAG: hypothetical protein EOS03_12390 [Mesorhizobium sp.]|uniref:hypothetical protein n=1 Tax=Mesorhizobium sp. TaxID=1871066 RepID=UPI000FEA1040|nr:hypothetical protein [Mesorhizobium sp.]RWN47151.1 MAG: hypothetical protein EOS03_12390 [Mesorhizobium sp.]